MKLLWGCFLFYKFKLAHYNSVLHISTLSSTLKNKYKISQIHKKSDMNT